MVEATEDLVVFDGYTGFNPVLLLDGHGNHFKQGFPDYVTKGETLWDCCIGLLYGTSYC